MPFEQPDSADATSTNLLKRNPFLIFRLVSLALLSNLALLSLIFASWNVNASLSARLSVPSTSVFIVFESCLFLIFMAISLLELFHPKRRVSYTVVECGWIGIASVFQIGAAISSTINGPAACHSSSDLGVCVSSVLLVPSTWFSSILALAYFLALFVSVITHKSLYPDIWTRTIFTIEWFGDRPREPSSNEEAIQNFLRGNIHLDKDPYRNYYEDIESTAARKRHYPIRHSIEQATPLREVKIRRGIDHPFGKPSSNQSSPIPQKVVIPLPYLPDRSVAPGSRYLEKFRDSNLLLRSESPLQYFKHYHASNPSFPPSIADLDKPIPLPELSEWVRAESAL